MPQPEIPSDVPFTLACAQCDVDSPESLEEALQQGWTRIQPDDGEGWNYLGLYPVCSPPWDDAVSSQT